jgi:hypothetical protein
MLKQQHQVLSSKAFGVANARRQPLLRADFDEDADLFDARGDRRVDVDGRPGEPARDDRDASDEARRFHSSATGRAASS